MKLTFGLGKNVTETKEVLQVDNTESSPVTSAENNPEAAPQRSDRIHHPVVRYGIDEYCGCHCR